MSNAYQKQHAGLMKDLLSKLPKKTSAEEKRFAELCYEKSLVAELEKLEHEKSIAIIQSMYEFLQQRTPGIPKIRVFSPTQETDGYSLTSTIIELINDDMPFLVDSLTAEMTRHGLAIRDTLHPVIPLTRDDEGKLISLGNSKDKTHESLIHFEVAALPDGLSEEELAEDLHWVIAHIRAAVEDWKTMLDKAKDVVSQIKHTPKSYGSAHIAEVKDFLKWLIDKNFVFLGYAIYGPMAEGEQSTKFGILRITDEAAPIGFETPYDERVQDSTTHRLIEITKSSRRSPVHRHVPMDYIAVTLFNDKGKIIGEARFVGLFTSTVYYQSTTTIPLVRAKISAVVERAGFSPSGHDGKALSAILEFLPRDEILQMDEDDLFETGMGILALESKPSVRIFVRKDHYERFISAMVYVPRERFSTNLRVKIQDLVEEAYNGSTTSFNTQIADVPLARLHLIVKTSPGDVPAVDVSKVENEIAKLAYLWSDQLFDALLERHDEVKAFRLHAEYGTAFPEAYINRYDAPSAAYDIDQCEIAIDNQIPVLELYQHGGDVGFANLKVYNPNQNIALSDILPVLENAGFRVMEEYPFELKAQTVENTIRIRDFRLDLPEGISDICGIKPLLEAVLVKMWYHEVENDRLNGLVLRASVSWQEVVILRAYAKYLKQMGFSIAQPTIEQSLLNNPLIVRELIALFKARFEPKIEQRDVKQHTHQQKIEELLVEVSSAVEDRVIRRYMDLMLATTRTNYYQQDDEGYDRPVLSFKFDSGKIPKLPLPKPFAEIFVYSRRVEGIHLRGGKIARGGLRWSDRHDDFRTEILGLMKAQMVKNSVIVPVGSKGGFVVKQPPKHATREEMQQEAIECYKLYLQGLLDITDNIAHGEVVAPKQVVRHDEDDPYLVVAADKGTASFSDIANGISESYGFWLGDAFASGGSAGYDHKEMGITARGAWVSVLRHFSEMGKDIALEDFTCVGIGDMSGDVFGNGMLLSEHTRLVAAFNHLHIFIDPTPDSKTSFKERKRLFEMPRSSWKDYNAALISKGGGIYDRSAKQITISEEACAALGADKTNFTPDELIRTILCAPVDLLWNGGIGTYVKASEETHDHAGDRANNNVRVDGIELRCKVVGEGGNLGFTQRGRIEYATMGGRINTDAIDNSAGVDCSDHEVNIKIAFSQALEQKRLTTEARNESLQAMTEEVAELVLQDNMLQTLAVSISEQRSSRWLEAHIRLIHALEKKGMLDRAIEFLPSDKQLQELKHSGKGLTRPELSVLLAYSKMDGYAALSQSEMLNHDYFTQELVRYFPSHMRSHFSDNIKAHPLRREIIATVLINSMINRMGMTFINDVTEDTGATVPDVAACYALVRDGFELRTLWDGLDSLSGIINVSLKAELFASIQIFVTQMVSWLVRYLPQPVDIEQIKSEYIDAVKQLVSKIPYEENTEAIQSLVEQQIPEPLARTISGLDQYFTRFDVIRLAKKTGADNSVVAEHYYMVRQRLSLRWLRQMLNRVTVGSGWERSAIINLRAASYDEQCRLTELIVGSGQGEEWFNQRQIVMDRYDRLLNNLKADDTADIARATVVIGQLRQIT